MPIKCLLNATFFVFAGQFRDHGTDRRRGIFSKYLEHRHLFSKYFDKQTLFFGKQTPFFQITIIYKGMQVTSQFRDHRTESDD